MGEDAKFSDHFSIKELACPHTEVIRLAPGFIDDLEELRFFYDAPMSVNSACRSFQHNKAVGGHVRSLHMYSNEAHDCDTCAVDIKRPKGPDLHRLIDIATTHGWSIGLANTFIHLDQRTKYTKSKLRQTFYTY